MDATNSEVDVSQPTPLLDEDRRLITGFLKHMERRNLSPGSVRAYQSILSGYVGQLDISGRTLLTATHEDVQTFLASRRLAARARYSYISTVHSFYRWLIREELADRDPTLRVDRPKLPKSLPRPISEPDLRRALAAADTRMTAWLCLVGYQGLRCAEVAGLQKRDLLLDHEPPMLVVSAGKGQKQRLLPLNPRTHEALIACGLPRRGAVFTRLDRPGKNLPIRPRAVSDGISKFLRDLGIDATAHQGRHRFGTKFYAATKDLRLTQEMLGHASPQTAAIYVAFAPTDAVDAIRGLE